MYKCKYCGRYLKDNYNNCPGCGSNKFEKSNNNHEIIKVTEVPKGGYKINVNNLKNSDVSGLLLIIMSIGVAIITIINVIVFGIPSYQTMLENNDFFIEKEFLIVFLFLAAITIMLLYFGIKLNKKHKEKIKRTEKLAHYGLLIKNLNYELVPSNKTINHKTIYHIKVLYENEQGIIIPLISEAKLDGKLFNKDGTVDLLIDPNDITNYFIDFEIY